MFFKTASLRESRPAGAIRGIICSLTPSLATKINIRPTPEETSKKAESEPKLKRCVVTKKTREEDKVKRLPTLKKEAVLDAKPAPERKESKEEKVVSREKRKGEDEEGVEAIPVLKMSKREGYEIIRAPLKYKPKDEEPESSLMKPKVENEKAALVSVKFKLKTGVSQEEESVSDDDLRYTKKYKSSNLRRKDKASNEKKEPMEDQAIIPPKSISNEYPDSTLDSPLAHTRENITTRTKQTPLGSVKPSSVLRSEQRITRPTNYKATSRRSLKKGRWLSSAARRNCVLLLTAASLILWLVGCYALAAYEIKRMT